VWPNRKRATITLLLFGVSFGYVEAAAASYLGAVYKPVRKRFFPERAPSDVFPLLRLEQLQASGPGYLRLLRAELAREFATLVMLAAVALAVGRSGGQWLAAFLVVFGTWDLSFYAFLKLLFDWPDSLLTWDLLFLIPVPWAAPVLAPVLVSLCMIGAGFLYLTREWMGRPVRLEPLHWVGFFCVRTGPLSRLHLGFSQCLRRRDAPTFPLATLRRRRIDWPGNFSQCCLNSETRTA